MGARRGRLGQTRTDGQGCRAGVRGSTEKDVQRIRARHASEGPAFDAHAPGARAVFGSRGARQDDQLRRHATATASSAHALHRAIGGDERNRRRGELHDRRSDGDSKTL